MIPRVVVARLLRLLFVAPDRWAGNRRTDRVTLLAS